MTYKLLFRSGGAPSLLGLLLLATTGCTAIGPSRQQVNRVSTQSSLTGVQIVDLDDSVARRLQGIAQPGFADIFGDAAAPVSIVRPGDVLQISIWEAPPSVLFGVQPQSTSAETSRSTSLPEFLVEPSGTISVPFAGTVTVAGRSLVEIERDITSRLRGKAHLPQVAVRLLRNQSANVTVVGEVTSSTRMPLTPKGEHLLDALAAGGGTRQPVSKTTIQLSRDGRVVAMPLEAIIRDPRQNIALKSGDVITAIFQPYSFTVLGATGKNEELNFEATGLTMAQAMGRVGGLQDGRADAKGVFLFRWEDPTAIPDRTEGVAPGPDGRIPVIYRVDMKNPTTYFAMQHFGMRDKDVIYVSNSPVAEFQRVVGLIASAVFPVLTVTNSVNTN